MTEETENPQPIETLPEIPAVGDSTISLAAPSEPEPVTALIPIIAPEAQISWKDELKEIVSLSEDELERVYQWVKSKV